MFGRLALGALDLGAFELRRDRADDARGHLVLQLEDIVEAAFEAFRPQMRPGGGIDQLSGDAHPVRGLAHAAFQHVAHAQLAADLLYVHRAALVGEARIARDHEQPANARQRGDDVLHHAVGEVLLFGVAAQVLEGQDGDRRLVGKGPRRCGCFIRRGGLRLRRTEAIRCVGFPDLANEPESLAGDGADQALFLAVVADRLADRIDVTGQGRLGNDPSAPHRVQQIILADDVLTVLDRDRPAGRRLAARWRWPLIPG